MVFPLGKLFYLALKQVARPISKQLQSTAKNSQFTKNRILMPMGQCKSVIDVLAPLFLARFSLLHSSYGSFHSLVTSLPDIVSF